VRFFLNNRQLYKLCVVMLCYAATAEKEILIMQYDYAVCCLVVVSHLTLINCLCTWHFQFNFVMYAK